MLSVLSACLWALAATGVALLPMRLQYAPGLALLLAAPGLVAWLAADHGPWLALAGAVAVVSLFRRPLRYLAGRMLARVSGGGAQGGPGGRA